MDYLHLTLPLFLAFPIIINCLASFYPKIRVSLALFLAPLALLGLSLVSFIQGGPLTLEVAKVNALFSLGISLDILSGLIGATVMTIGIIVVRFSVRYLEDDPDQEGFSKNLSLTLFFVLSMLMSPNLVQFFLSWFGTSYFLHNLLTHFSKREGALKAAHQKFWVSRLGDVFILSAGVILFLIVGSLDFDSIFQAVGNSEFIQENRFLINLASIFIVLGAMTKSAQFPFHFWLPNTMETPTPVSALMHAGIINAGGYLVIRMSPLLSKATVSLSLLAIIGGLTTFWATLVMFTQPNVKKSLAYSTISQMGFMMLQCGLGAFSIAVVHIIGHSFYKAYSFLSSASATDIGKLNRYFPKEKMAQSVWSPFFYALLTMAIFMSSLKLIGFGIQADPGKFILVMILSLAISQIFLNTNEKFRSLSLSLTIVSLYFLLSAGTELLLKGIIPESIQFSGALTYSIFFLCAFLFLTLYLIQNNLEKISNTEIGRRIYAKSLKGEIL
ncbi:MAG: hypothetical protein K9K67_08470 [Bacteriovoracaceae bacterium]|nr:hypothetical protein [Bacteriovoracaceae bacterium]